LEGIIVTALRRPAEPAECVNGYAMDEIPLPRRMHTVTHTHAVLATTEVLHTWFQTSSDCKANLCLSYFVKAAESPGAGACTAYRPRRRVLSCTRTHEPRDCSA
jgi:hypothetical protein